MNIILDIIFKGKIPFRNWISRAVYLVAFLSPVLLIWFSAQFTEFSSYGFTLLFLVMLVRPVANVFPDFRIFRGLMLLRREFGVLSAMLLLEHFFGFVLAAKISIFDVFSDSYFWDYNNYLFWGLLGISVSLPVLITSNDFSMRLLKGTWKHVQKLSYLFFIFGAIHVYLIGKDDALLYAVVLAVFWVMAFFKFQIKLPEKWRQKLL